MHIIYEKKSPESGVEGHFGKQPTACYFATTKPPFFPFSATCLLYFTLPRRRWLWLQRCTMLETDLNQNSPITTPTTAASIAAIAFSKGLSIAKWSGILQLAVTKHCPVISLETHEVLLAPLMHHLAPDKVFGSCFGQQPKTSAHKCSLSRLCSLFPKFIYGLKLLNLCTCPNCTVVSNTALKHHPVL